MKQLKYKYLSGIKPTGDITLGNYLGVIQPAINIKKETGDEVLFFIADMHAFTTPNGGLNISEHIKQLENIFRLSGLTFFNQSDIAEHNQLGYIMEYLAKDWELRNQIQYKEKKGKETRVSLLTYPALMAADCLMYDIPFILVGEDQMTHIHLMNDLVDSFEREFGDGVLNRPVGEVGNFPKIKDLRDPNKKMSKSNGDNGCIFLFDKPEDAYSKIMRAVTDSDNSVLYDEENKPGVSNLMNIYSALGEISKEDIVDKYKDLPFPYVEFKKDLANTVKEFLEDFQLKYNEVVVDEESEQNFTNELRVYAWHKMKGVMKSMGL